MSSTGSSRSRMVFQQTKEPLKLGKMVHSSLSKLSLTLTSLEELLKLREAREETRLALPSLLKTLPLLHLAMI
jgi:hypothetical protein